MPQLSAEFGYYPQPLDLTSGPVTIATLANLEQIVTDVTDDDTVDGEWIYCGSQLTQNFGGEVFKRPYPARVFGLPKTHRLEHSSADGPDHLNFHFWALSFLTGMRLMAEEAGFLERLLLVADMQRWRAMHAARTLVLDNARGLKVCEKRRNTTNTSTSCRIELSERHALAISSTDPQNYLIQQIPPAQPAQFALGHARHQGERPARGD